MNVIGLIAAAALLGVAGQNPVQSPVATDATPANPGKICKRVVPTGSILPIKICLTNPEWKEFTARTNAGAEQFLSRRGTGMCDPRMTPDCGK